jgi:hypothetical protein
MRRWVRLAATMPAETLYRAAFALWLLNARQSLLVPELYDGDEPAKLAASFEILPGTRPPPVSRRPLLEADAMRAIHATGLAAVESWLGPAASHIPAWLGRAEDAAGAAWRDAAPPREATQLRARRAG